VLDACGHDEVEVPRLNRGGAVEGGLHRRSALAVDGCRAHRLRPACDEDCASPDVERLLADLRDTTHLDVLDLAGIDVGPREEAVQDLCCQLVRADLGQGATAPADRRPDRIDDVRVSHAPDGTTRRPLTTLPPWPRR
jgi:hypothetical protein